MGFPNVFLKSPFTAFSGERYSFSKSSGEILRGWTCLRLLEEVEFSAVILKYTKVKAYFETDERQFVFLHLLAENERWWQDGRASLRIRGWGRSTV